MWIGALLLLSIACAALAHAGEARIPASLSWLPASIEMILVDQQPTQLTPIDLRDRPDAITTVRGFGRVGLRTAESGKLMAALSGRTMNYSVAGTQLVASPELAVGGPVRPVRMAQQSCGVYAFSEPLPTKLFDRPPDESVSGQQVWRSFTTLPPRQPDNTTTVLEYYATLLEPALLMVCTNKELFASVVTARSATPAPSQFESWPEWRYVNRTAPVLGLRHFRRSSFELDAMHPAVGRLTGVRDPNARGLSIQFNAPAGVVQSRWLSDGNVNPWRTLMVNKVLRNASVHSLPDGNVVLTVEERDGNGMGTAAILLGMLGFAELG